MNIYSPYSASQPPLSPYRSPFVPLSPDGGAPAAPLGGNTFFCPSDRSAPSATVTVVAPPSSSRVAERAPSAPAATSSLPAFAGSQGEGYPWLKLLAGVGTFGASAFLLHRFLANPAKTALSHAVSDAVEKPVVQKLAEKKPTLNTPPKQPPIAKPDVSQPVTNHAEPVSKPQGPKQANRKETPNPPEKTKGPDKPNQPVEPIPSDKSGKSDKTSGADQKAPANAVQTATKNGDGISHEIATEAEKLAKTGGKGFLRQAAGTAYAAGRAGAVVLGPIYVISKLSEMWPAGVWAYYTLGIMHSLWLEFRHNCKAM